jgi:uncharacterized protein YbcV (DUF1398 family)
MNSIKSYEIEIDYSVNKESKSTDKTGEMIIDELETIKKVLEGNDNIITKDENNLVIESYKKLVAFNESINNSLYSMQPISAEVQHVVDKFPNFYSVTDKADGEKYQLFIHNKTVYLISNNLNVKKTKYISDLSNTIIEGELIFLNEENKYIFMGFDCLYYSNKDIRDEPNLKLRLEYVSKVCKSLNKEIYTCCTEFPGKFDITAQEKFYIKEIDNFYKNVKIQVDKLKINEIFFHPKLFIFPSGADNSEVYSFAYIIWDYYSRSNISYKLYV